jgi:hypothetical protein
MRASLPLPHSFLILEIVEKTVFLNGVSFFLIYTFRVEMFARVGGEKKVSNSRKYLEDS